MPLYRYTTAVDGDLDDTEVAFRYATEQDATDAAQECLVDMAREKLPNGKRAEFVAIVRDHDENVVYRATLTLNAQDREDLEVDDRAKEQALGDLKDALANVKRPPEPRI